MASKEAEAYADRLRQFAADAVDAPTELEAIRERSRHLFESMGGDISIEREPVNAGGVPALWVRTPNARADKVVAFWHGGGYITGSSGSHANFAAKLATRLNATVFAADYRLAPEHVFPAQIEDCLAAYRWLLECGHGSGDIVFAGESAGGALSIQTQLVARDHGLPVPSAAFVMSPWLDFESLGASHVENAARDLSGSVQGTAAAARLFLGPDGDVRDPLACPLYGRLAGIAPLYAQVGGCEIMVDDARRLVEIARRDGVEAVLDVVPDMQHMFQMNAGEMPEADAALDRGAAFLSRFLN
jgi:acetyl esterase/lipase